MLPVPNVVLADRYLLNRRIAVGGMGEVWEANDRLLDRVVAVKILKDELRLQSTFLDRFRAEARHSGQLSHHGIATVYDYGETADIAFLVMELVRGRPLSDLLTAETTLRTAAKLSILAQAAEGLQAAHAAGVVHRDVKPGNLMVREDGTVKVTDFGIARALASASLTDHGQMIGTPGYVSPEQATGEQVTASSDIYSLGVVAYEMFAGHPPFVRDTPLALALAHVNESPPPLPGDVPPRVAELIESAMAKDPAMRPASAALFASRLREELAAGSSAPPATAPMPHLRPPAATMVMPTGAPAVARASTPMATQAQPMQRAGGRPSPLMIVALIGLLALMGAAVWAATRPDAVDSLQPDGPLPSTVTDASVTAVSTSETAPPGTSPIGTQPATTQPATTQPATTQPATTEVAVTQPPSTQPPATQPPAVTLTAADEAESLAFVTDYYETLAAGGYEVTWELLSTGFREDRDLNFGRYKSYWENTTIEIDNLRFVAGPGELESRIVFEADYETSSGDIEETDEITIQRQPDGSLIITKQRTV